MVKMHLDGLWDIWRAAVFFIYIFGPFKNRLPPPPPPISIQLCFFCLASLLCFSTNRCNEYLTNISFFPFKYLYRYEAARSPLSSSFPFFFIFHFSTLMCDVQLSQIRIIYVCECII